MPIDHNDESTAAAEGKPAVASVGFKFPLPIDPIRLFAGVLARWPILLITALCGLVAGVIAGVFLTKPSFTVGASLIKRKVPQNVQASETGQAYRPADLNDPTLLATLLAAEPLEKAVARVKNGLDSRTARRYVEASQQKGTDIYFVTYHSPFSPEDARKFASTWAEEIREYTKRLQQSDARGVRDILQNEVADMDKRLTAIHKQIMDFSREKQFLGTDTQVTSALNQMGQTDLELENAKSSLKAKDTQIEALVTELRRQSPIDAQLKTAHEEVSALRATYTDENPLVKAKLQGISFLEEKLKEFSEQDDVELERYTGTPIGNQLFLDILSLKNARTEALGKVESYTALHKVQEDRIKEFPAILSRYQELEKLRASTLSSLTLLSNRLKETEIFASSAPGYWQIFEGAEEHDIVLGSKTKLPIMLGIGGAGTGLVVGVLLLLTLTSRGSRRSVIECCTTARAPLLSDYYAEDPTVDAFDRLWITALSGRMRAGESILAWTVFAQPDDERTFWKSLAAATARDGLDLPVIVDLTPDKLWEGSPPDGLKWLQETAVAVQGGLYRASKLPAAQARGNLAKIDFWFALVSGEKDCLKRAVRTRELSAGHLPSCGGTVAVIPIPASHIRRLGDKASRFIARHFSRPPAPATTHE